MTTPTAMTKPSPLKPRTKGTSSTITASDVAISKPIVGLQEAERKDKVPEMGRVRARTKTKTAPQQPMTARTSKHGPSSKKSQKKEEK